MGAVLTGTIPPGQAIQMEEGTYPVSNSVYTYIYYNPHIDVTYKATRTPEGGWYVIRYPYNACGSCWEKVRENYGF